MSFLGTYRADRPGSAQSHPRQRIELTPIPSGFHEFVRTIAGQSFNRGIYRLHDIGDMPKWTALVAEAFPKFAGRVFCFSSDWLGRHFALDLRLSDQILMLEPGTGECLEIPVDFKDFHDSELVHHHNEVLASGFYRTWLDSKGEVPKLAECIGYKRPLFLGGEDIVENLELIDMEVYWSLCGQLLAGVRNLPEGTKIGTLRIS